MLTRSVRCRLFRTRARLLKSGAALAGVESHQNWERTGVPALAAAFQGYSRSALGQNKKGRRFVLLPREFLKNLWLALGGSPGTACHHSSARSASQFVFQNA